MGAVCCVSRGQDKDISGDSFSTESCSHETHSKTTYVKKIRGLIAATEIHEESFQHLIQQNITSIYKRGAESFKTKHFTLYPVVHIASGLPGLMKIIDKKKSEGSFLEKFFESISIQRSLDHPNIAKIHELLEDDYHYYIIYQHMKVIPLDQYLTYKDEVTESQLLHIMKQIFSAVAFLHRKSIVNGNITLGNFFMANNQSVKLLDFFSSRRLKGSEKSFRKMPNRYYAAPEVLEKQGYDEKSEMWSCGALMHVLVDAEARSKSQSSHSKFDLSEIEASFKRKCWQKFSLDTKELILELLSLKPSDRPTAETVLMSDLFRMKSGSTDFNQTILSHFRSFKVKNQFHRLLLYFIVERILPLEDKLEYLKLFESFDRNLDGTLSKTEIVQRYSKIRDDPIAASKEIESVFSALGKEKTDYITFTEFLMVVVNKDLILSKPKLEQAFKLLDLDSSGGISKEELALSLGLNQISADEWDEVIRNVDSDFDRYISFEELRSFLCNSYELETTKISSLQKVNSRKP